MIFDLTQVYIYMLENMEGAIKIAQSRETGNTEKLAIQSTQYKEKHNTIYVGHHYMQTNTNNVYKTWALLQTTGGKEEPNTVFMFWKMLLSHLT